MEQLKTLYFEGAGMDFYDEAEKFSDVGNFRIRTSFKNLDGKHIYLEMANGAKYDFSKKKPKKTTNFGLYVLHLFEVVKNDGTDDENETRISYNRESLKQLKYTKKDITNWINKNLNCNFDTIEVLNYFYGYRVHGNNRTYNLMEDIELNHKRAKAREKTYNNIDMEYRKKLNEKYSKISLLKMDHDSITIRCYASDQAIKNKELPRIQKLKVSY